MQVRSIFGAGLFTGNYKINLSSSYSDSIRKNWNSNNKINFERYKLFTDLEREFKNFSFKEKKSINIKELMLSFLMIDIRIDTIVLGGSGANQINETINYLSNKENRNLFLNSCNFHNMLI